jgi:hypothetical protein
MESALTTILSSGNDNASLIKSKSHRLNNINYDNRIDHRITFERVLRCIELD